MFLLDVKIKLFFLLRNWVQIMYRIIVEEKEQFVLTII